MMRNINNFLYRNQEGGVLIFMGLAAALLIAAMGIAIDMGRVFLVRTKAQTALDASVLAAAAVSYQTDTQGQNARTALLQQRGEEFFRANFPSGYMGSDPGALPDFEALGEDGVTVRAELSLGVNTFFGNFVMDFYGSPDQGLDNIGMDELAQVDRVIDDVDIEIAMALDFTTSMCEGPGGCNGKFANMRESVILLIETLKSTLQATSGNSSLRFAMIPFTHTVKLNNNVQHLNRLYDNRDPTFKALPNSIGLRTNTSAIENALNTNPDGISGTNVAVGIYWAWQALRPFIPAVNSFQGASRHEGGAPAALNRTGASDDDKTYKMLLVLTDGKNEYGRIQRPTGWVEEDDPIADENQRTHCNNAKAEGIEIRTIAFAVADANARNLLEACASTRDGRTFYYEVNDPSDSDALRRVFREIANDLIDLRMTR